VLRRVLLAAIVAGIAAGIALTFVQHFRVVPLILAAEEFENAPKAPKSGETAPHATPKGSPEAATSPHRPEAKAWEREEGFERTVFTLLANVLAGTAFALLLAGAMTLSGRDVSLGAGTVWGLVGYLVFSIAPALGLAPELPGMPSAELTARQIWWWATVLATAGGIALLVFPQNIALKSFGAALVVIPHLVGAPHPASYDSPVPAGLAAQFVAASLATAALFWIVIGGATGLLLRRQTGM
jgi:cobalt transporter subunit CbtA